MEEHFYPGSNAMFVNGVLPKYLIKLELEVAYITYWTVNCGSQKEKQHRSYHFHSKDGNPQQVVTPQTLPKSELTYQRSRTLLITTLQGEINLIYPKPPGVWTTPTNQWPVFISILFHKKMTSFD